MVRKEKNIHYIYKTTCNVTGRYYVGMHSTCNLEDGYMGSGKRLRYSIRYHGIENHTKEILEYLPTREELVIREIEIVTNELIAEDLCMNLREGGTGGFVNAEHQIKCSKAGNIGHSNKFKTNEEYRNKFSSFLNNMGKHTEHLRRDTMTNKKHSEKSKKQTSETMKGKGTGVTNSQFGSSWMIKKGVVKKIKKEDIIKYTNEGWIKGRKNKEM